MQLLLSSQTVNPFAHDAQLCLQCQLDPRMKNRIRTLSHILCPLLNAHNITLSTFIDGFARKFFKNKKIFRPCSRGFDKSRPQSKLRGLTLCPGPAFKLYEQSIRRQLYARPTRFHSHPAALVPSLHRPRKQISHDTSDNHHYHWNGPPLDVFENHI